MNKRTACPLISVLTAACIISSANASNVQMPQKVVTGDEFSVALVVSEEQNGGLEPAPLVVAPEPSINIETTDEDLLTPAQKEALSIAAEQKAKALEAAQPAEQAVAVAEKAPEPVASTIARAPSNEFAPDPDTATPAQLDGMKPIAPAQPAVAAVTENAAPVTPKEPAPVVAEAAKPAESGEVIEIRERITIASAPKTAAKETPAAAPVTAAAAPVAEKATPAHTAKPAAPSAKETKVAAAEPVKKQKATKTAVKPSAEYAAMKAGTAHAEDGTFEKIAKAYKAKDLNGVSELTKTLTDHPLKGYAELWEMLLRLEKAPSDKKLIADVEKFIKANDGDYLEERARTDLARIAGKAGNIPLFMKHYSRLDWNKTEPDLACHKADFDLRSSATAEHIEAAQSALVKAVKPSIAACRQLGRTFVEKAPGRAWVYAMILMQQKRFAMARELIASRPQSAWRFNKTEALQVLDNPSRWLAANRKKASSKPVELFVLAALRMAPKDHEGAASAAMAVNRRISANLRGMLWGRIAYEGALDYEKNALRWYSLAGAGLAKAEYTVGAEEVLAWQVRSALLFGNNSRILSSIAKLPAATQKDETWVYWKAWALNNSGKKQQAAKLWRSISSNLSFYGMLASDSLGRRYGFGSYALRPKSPIGKYNSFAANESIARAVRFYALDMAYEGNREWNWFIRGLKTPGDRLLLAEFAGTINVTHRLINTSASSGKVVFTQRYPQAFAGMIRKAAESNSLPDSLVFGLIRQESRFISKAQSSAGALGLMQVMPATARLVARNTGMTSYRDSQLTEVDTNLTIGTAYLRRMMDDFEGNVALTAAAYNAGPSRAQSWSTSIGRRVAGAIFAETIPFGETRNYVKQVSSNMVCYSQYGGKGMRLTKVLGSVAPQNPKQKNVASK